MPTISLNKIAWPGLDFRLVLRVCRMHVMLNLSLTIIYLLRMLFVMRTRNKIVYLKLPTMIQILSVKGRGKVAEIFDIRNLFAATARGSQ